MVRNPAAHAAYMREYTRKNSERINAQRRERAAARREAGIKPPPRRVYLDRPCGQCGKTERFPSGPCIPCTMERERRKMIEDPEGARLDVNARQLRVRAKKTAAEKWAHDQKWNLARVLKERGLTKEEFHAMEDAQENRCAICGDPPTGKRFRRLAIDHCHDTGKVRGLLCHRCNLCIGQFKDDVSIIQKAIEYLKSHKERT